jgi:pimeloyl-ACP methyl ester carboxylesterase
MKRRFGDREIGYDDVGTGVHGAPVVLLHPFPFDRRYWAPTVEALAPARRVIAVDARGFGESPPAGAFAIADLADDLAAVLDALGVATATVVGLSMGGYTALAFAHRHAARLAALVLADTRAAADSPETRRARDDARALIESSGAELYLDRSLPRLLAPDAPPAVLARVRALAEIRGDRIIAGLAALRDRPDRAAELAAIRCPTLVIGGTRDQVVPLEEMRGMSAAIAGANPGARFVGLDGIGHLANIEAPAAFETALRTFLDEHTARAK